MHPAPLSGACDEDPSAVSARRLDHLQRALGAIWIIDALLQAQPANFTSGLAGAIVGNAMGQPHWLQVLLVWSAARFASQPIGANLTLVVLQLALGLGILWHRTRRATLLASIPYALAVWVVGEGLGNLASGFAMFPSGAPGAALLVAAAALILLPPGTPRVTAPADGAAASAAGGERFATALWASLFFAAAVLQAIPVGTLGFKLAANLQMATLGEPPTIAHGDGVVSRFVGGHGALTTAVLIASELAIGSAALLSGRARRNLLIAACGAFLVFWAVGENFGSIASGSASDIGAMPVYALIAASLWPVRVVARRPIVRPALAPAAHVVATT